MCLEALGDQRFSPLATYVFDTGLDPAAFAEVAARFSGVEFEMGSNRGYAGAANHLLARIGAERPQADYVLLLNPDTTLDAEFGAELVGAMERDPRVALASGKLLRPGRARIDSAGIVLPRHRRPRDRGSGELDAGQYDGAEYVFAVSGAALMLRRAAVESLAIAGEIFDEDFFVYHEDTDLAWRAHRLGWGVLYEPRATAIHGRGWRAEHRFRVPVEARRHSFKNHYLQIAKNETARDLVRNLPWLIGWECLRLGYALLRDRALLTGYAGAWRLRHSAREKRKQIALRAHERAQ